MIPRRPGTTSRPLSVNPARAGMILPPVRIFVSFCRKPRASGDDPAPGGEGALP